MTKTNLAPNKDLHNSINKYKHLLKDVNNSKLYNQFKKSFRYGTAKKEYNLLNEFGITEYYKFIPNCIDIDTLDYIDIKYLNEGYCTTKLILINAIIEQAKAIKNNYTLGHIYSVMKELSLHKQLKKNLIQIIQSEGT